MNEWASNLKSLYPDDNLHAWLTKPYIITQAMKKCCKNLSLSVLGEHFSTMYQDEFDFFSQLHQVSKQSLIRKIYLNGDNIPWSFGRVVIPQETFDAYRTIFENLDNKPIGESFLYKNPDINRSSFQYCQLFPSNSLYQEAITNLNTEKSKKSLWGRRSIFSLEKGPLMITEIYLPDVPTYPEASL